MPVSECRTPPAVGGPPQGGAVVAAEHGGRAHPTGAAPAAPPSLPRDLRERIAGLLHGRDLAALRRVSAGWSATARAELAARRAIRGLDRALCTRNGVSARAALARLAGLGGASIDTRLSAMVGRDGRTWPSRLAAAGEVALLALLADAGVALGRPDAVGMDAITWAAWHGQHGVLQALSAWRVRPPREPPATPLLVAALRDGDMPLLRVCLARVEPFRAAAGPDGDLHVVSGGLALTHGLRGAAPGTWRLPASLVAHVGHSEAAMAHCLAAAARGDEGAWTREGVSALHLLCADRRPGRDAMLAALVARLDDATLAARTPAGFTPLHLVVSRSHFPEVAGRLLLMRGVNVRDPVPGCGTAGALTLALTFAQEPEGIVRKLLQCGAEPELRDLITLMVRPHLNGGAADVWRHAPRTGTGDPDGAFGGLLPPFAYRTPASWEPCAMLLRGRGIRWTTPDLRGVTASGGLDMARKLCFLYEDNFARAE